MADRHQERQPREADLDVHEVGAGEREPGVVEGPGLSQLDEEALEPGEGSPHNHEKEVAPQDGEVHPHPGRGADRPVAFLRGSPLLRRSIATT